MSGSVARAHEAGATAPSVLNHSPLACPVVFQPQKISETHEARIILHHFQAIKTGLPSNMEKSMLRQLPPELRNVIWNMVLGPKRTIRMSFGLWPRQVCVFRQFRQDLQCEDIRDRLTITMLYREMRKETLSMI